MEAEKRVSTSSAAATESEVTINDLDEDSLCTIFNKLPYRDRVCIESVCKRWRDVSKASWCLYSKHLTFSRDPNTFPSLLGNTQEKNKNILEKILQRRGPYLEEITFPKHIYFCNRFEPGTVKRIVEYCTKLKRLNAGIQVLNAEDWLACSNLEALSLTYYSDCEGSRFSELFRRNKRLRRLEIFSAPCEASIFDHLDPGQLEILHIISCPYFELTAGLTDKLAESLVELNYNSYSQITHNVQHLSKLKNLRSLILKIQYGGLKFIDDIAKNCQKLEHFNLTLFEAHTHNQNLIQPLFNLPCLRSLVIILNKYEISYEELDRLFREAPKLKFFVLSSCVRCTYEEDNIDPCYAHRNSPIKNTNSVASDFDEAVIITAA